VFIDYMASGRYSKSGVLLIVDLRKSSVYLGATWGFPRVRTVRYFRVVRHIG
jgi:hypothetical protein